MEHHHDHDHDHHHEHADGSYGVALGIRIFEDDGKLYYSEVEIGPYVDEPNALGATLVFHPLDGLDPTAPQEEDWPAWQTDFDDELERDQDAAVPEQFASIARQVGRLSEGELRDLLTRARQETEE